MTVLDENLLSAEIIYKIMLSRSIDEKAQKQLNRQSRVDLLDLTRTLINSDEFLRIWTIAKHLDLIHEARLQAVQRLIPPGRRILDLGGANAPLHRMGYPHLFDEIILVDLPSDQRHEMYRDVVLSDEMARGRVSIHYGDMTKLADFDSSAFDLAWSGQSIEHVPADAAERMVREVFRVLKPGGHFCLDTPNGLITSIHAQTVDMTMIHPEHFVEYHPDALRALLEKVGFRIEAALGIREMPATAATSRFDYLDFLRGKAISTNVKTSYIQFYTCIKD